MRSVLVLRTAAVVFPRRTDYYPVMYISLEVFLLDLLYSLYGSVLEGFSASVRFLLMDRELCALFMTWNLKTARFH